MNIEDHISNLNSEDEADRMYAAEDLGVANDPAGVGPLIERLGMDPSRAVKEAIFLALAAIDHPSVVAQAADLLAADDAFLRNSAIQLLQGKGEAAICELLKKLKDPDPDVRKFALDAAAGINHPAVAQIYEIAIEDPEINVLIAAVEHIGRTRQTNFKNRIEFLFEKSTHPMLLSALLSTLIQIGDEKSWEAIQEGYPTSESVPGYLLSWWIQAFGRFGGIEDLEALPQILSAYGKSHLVDLIDALSSFQERFGTIQLPPGCCQTLADLSTGPISNELKRRLLMVVERFPSTEEINLPMISRLSTLDMPSNGKGISDS